MVTATKLLVVFIGIIIPKGIKELYIVIEVTVMQVHYLHVRVYIYVGKANCCKDCENVHICDKI